MSAYSRISNIARELYQSGRISFAESAALIMAVENYTPDSEATHGYGTLSVLALFELRKTEKP